MRAFLLPCVRLNQNGPQQSLRCADQPRSRRRAKSVAVRLTAIIQPASLHDWASLPGRPSRRDQGELWQSPRCFPPAKTLLGAILRFTVAHVDSKDCNRAKHRSRCKGARTPPAASSSETVHRDESTEVGMKMLSQRNPPVYGSYFCSGRNDKLIRVTIASHARFSRSG